MESYLAAIISALFGVNMALVGWTFHKLDAKVTALSSQVSALQTEVAVLTAIKGMLERAAHFR